MEKLVVQCNECSYLMISEKQDGVRCYECGGMTSPIGYVVERPVRRKNNTTLRLVNYEVWGKDEFIKYLLSAGITWKEMINDRWTKISKGYNFVIAIYRNDINGYDLLSVKKFNELLERESTYRLSKEENNAKEDM